MIQLIYKETNYLSLRLISTNFILTPTALVYKIAITQPQEVTTKIEIVATHAAYLNTTKMGILLWKTTKYRQSSKT